ncbi:MAG: hemerythrin domain-containing protein [Planctomycetaceae bacterium]
MNIAVLKSVPQVLDHWHDEDRSLKAYLTEVRKWMREVEQRGIPHFGETATRLHTLRERLVQHFDHEDKMLHQIADIFLNPTPEIDSVRSQTIYEHQQLLSTLDDLRGRLLQLQPPFASWQAAMKEVDEFFVALEQHELQESESVRSLTAVASQHEPELE